MMSLVLCMSFSFFFFLTKNYSILMKNYLKFLFCLFILKYLNIFLSVSSFSYFFFLDQFTYIFLVLNLLIFFFSFFTLGSNENNLKIKNFMMFFLFFIVCLSFMVESMIMFYCLFEFSVLPLFVLILGWGYQVERFEAGMMMLLYTCFFSLPFFFFTIFFFSKMFWFNMFVGNLNVMKMEDLFFCLLYISIFLVKCPVFFLHSWLPKAHVEAPLVGSMILAGIMLKLGCYGLLRLLMCFIFNMDINLFIMIFCMMGGILVSLICLVQMDIKILIALSSVSHMSLVLLGLMSSSWWGLLGSVIMIFSHGVSSSCLFFLGNFFFYRMNSRNLFFMRGILSIIPSMGMIWSLLCFFNISCPPSMGIFAEIFITIGTISVMSLMSLFFFMFFFISCCYCIYLFISCYCGEMKHFFLLFEIYYMKEFIISLWHVIILFFAFIYLNFFFI